jgi:competence protein ComEC
MLAEIRTRNTPTALADPRRDIDLGDGVVLDILWPPPGLLGARVSRSKLNDTSVMLRVTHGTGSILITGDTEERSERALLATRQNLRADILVVPHHGSKTSSSTGFLLAVRPSLAIVSAGRGNPYGHPHPAILARYRALGIQMRMTASGTVAIVLP